MLKKFFDLVESKVPSNVKILLGLLVAYLIISNAYEALKPNDVVKSAVKITNLSGNSGGSGVIISSKKGESLILTNSHVCEVVHNGGNIHSTKGIHSVNSYKHSLSHDICLIKVLDNLGVNTNISNRSPVHYYESAYIAGHPQLLPTVVTSGHFSGKMTVSVVTDFKKCTEEDLSNPDTAMYCVFFGGIPVIKMYESTLVTATIMPGSSGSGVFNESKELSGLAFAGSGQLGYAWTVPYEYLRDFIDFESKEIPFSKPNSILKLDSGKNEQKRNAKKACIEIGIKLESIKRICDLLQRDLIWSE